MILLLGDIHGNFNYIKELIIDKKISDCDIIQVGDFGIGFTSEYNDKLMLENFNETLQKQNITMYAFRGNHDNPQCFKGDWKWSNLHLIPDYTVLELEGNKILCIGGALSIDRKPRIAENMSNARYGSEKRKYWYDEEVVFNEDILNNIKGVNILLTHTAPNFCVPLNKIGFGDLVDHFAQNDPNLYKELTDERNLMTKIFNTLSENNQIDYHFYGHFHRSYVEKIGNCTHRILGINEFYELRNKNYE
jgi:predicted phosphodiesterase